MGARLQFAKVIDRQLFYERGARIHPALESQVLINDEPGDAAAFLVIRGWSDDHGTFTEQWRIETPGGTTVYESAPRELHLATTAHTERLEDEVADLKFEYAADDYSVVFTLDDNEVARVGFPVATGPSEDGARA
ncbi:MAG TPA: hypothetical protein VFK89_04970 [Actinomycetota bacterium]|nr:hypothetical protein [Actinomycetota bacterium]